MRTAALLALRDLSSHRWRALAWGSVFSIAVLAFVALSSYREALQNDYAFNADQMLIVGEAHAIAEYYGSRISAAEAEAALAGRGIDQAIPEIHELVGTSFRDAVLMKGVDLNGYAQLDAFTILKGRALQPGDSPRQAMIGIRLAERLAAEPGSLIRLRGRDFEVIGIFETGSYTENEAWVPLAGAQDLLGWGNDVSLYVIADDGKIKPGEQLGTGLSVQRRGERFSTFPQTWSAMLALIQVVTQAIGAAAALSLSAMLWRLAWQRRWQIAILRTIGFGRGVSAVYLGLQAAVISLAGGLVGMLGFVGVVRWMQVSLSGISVQPHVSFELILATSLWLCALTVLSVLAPVLMLSRLRVSSLLSADS